MQSTTTAHEIASLSDRLYDAVYDRNRLAGAMIAIQEQIGAIKGTFAVFERGLGGGEAYFADCDDKFLAPAMSRRNPMISPMSASTPGTIVTHETLPAGHFENSEFFSEWAVPQNFRRVSALITMREGPLVGFMGFSWDTVGKEERAHELLAALSRTLDRVTRLYLLAGAMRLRESADAFDQMGIGAVIVDSQCRAVRINATAEGLFLQADTGISLLQGKLTPTDPAGFRPLSDIISSALQDGELGMNPGGQIILRSGRAENRPALSVSVSPMRPALAYGLPTTRAALVLLQPIGMRVEAGFEARLQNLFGLTRAEAALAIALMAGQSPLDVAEVRGVSINTVRSQLVQLFRKTGTTGQPQLAALLVRIVPFGPHGRA